MVKEADRHAEYYEAVIQLRPATEEIIRFIKNQCKKRGEAITKVVELKTGFDLYITSQKLARTMAPKLKKAFGGEVKVTKKIHTKDRQTSKSLYRATVLFRPESKDL